MALFVICIFWLQGGKEKPNLMMGRMVRNEGAIGQYENLKRERGPGRDFKKIGPRSVKI